MGTAAIGPTNDGPQRRTAMRLILAARDRWRAALIAGMALLPVSVPAMAQQHGGTLIAAFSADPAGFDPVRGPSGMSHVVIEQVYSTLMLLDPDAKPIPGLADPTKCPLTARSTPSSCATASPFTTATR